MIELLILMGLVGAVTFGIRYVPMALISGQGGDEALPPLVKRALRYVPPAVLSAIFVPELLMPKGVVDISLSNIRLLAGIIAILVALTTRRVLPTILIGMVALWVLTGLGVR
jgi:branched-subunit amino acid transport protein